MKDNAARALDDLAFVRALVSEGGHVQASLGKALLAGGLCFGGQCAAFWAVMIAGWKAPGGVMLAISVLPSVLFIVLVVRISWGDRKNSELGVGTRALNAAFGGSGLAALTTALIFGYLAARERSMLIWMFHPLMVCVVQGTVWYIAFAIRRRGWFALVSAGWFGSALLGALTLGRDAWFVFVLGMALFLLMALPGWILMRGGARG